MAIHPSVAGAGKSPGALLGEAMQLYQKHLATLLLTCAVLMGPVSVVKSGATALILAPTMAVEVSAKNAERLSQRTAEQFQRQLQEAQRDPNKWQQTSRDQQKQMEELSKAWATTGTAAVGVLMAFFLGLLALVLGVALMYGVAVPLTTGALTIIVADRATGGNAGIGQAFALLFGRLGKLLGAWIPAFFFVVLGLFFLVIPGLVLGFLFVFVTPVVLLENVGGMAALKRSVALVKANVGQVLIMCLIFAAIRIVSRITAHLFIPHSALFLGSLVEDALLILPMPVPIIGTVLLYLDIRRQADGLDEQGLRAGIEGLKRA
jgi:uncharacterized membrane protein